MYVCNKELVKLINVNIKKYDNIDFQWQQKCHIHIFYPKALLK